MRRVDTLFLEMDTVAPYSPGTEAVPERMSGTAFFPGGSGLWRPARGDSLPEMPVGGAMLIGQDFDTKVIYDRLKEKGEETRSPTWRSLLELLEDASISPKDCFFTNAWMGLRSNGPSTGPYAGSLDAGFTARCTAFLACQLATQRPRLIVTLGKQSPQMLMKLSRPLSRTWQAFDKFSDIDSKNAGMVPIVRFDSPVGLEANIVALVHPCHHYLNVKNRRFTSNGGETLVGHEAEVAMLRAGWAQRDMVPVQPATMS